VKDRTQRWVDAFLLALFTVVVIIVVGLITFAAQGCSTVTPTPVKPTQAAFSGNDQNGGIIGLAPPGAGYVVTADFRDRYNALIAVYGKDILPPLKADEGITARADGTCVIDKQHLVDEILMADWHRMGRSP
jgi:hypothetical protein